ncbi:RNA polymerase sigma factor [Phenylobacterium sp.]|uniref:RNA polymerase sigma factor n=1 Tax=Phenylobacterium sp. TaxID=1871053 RepID=UPI0035674E05
MDRVDLHQRIEAVWRIEAAQIIAGLARYTRDVGVAEELAQDALVAALAQWPGSGVPRNPGAWLMTAAKRRAIDRLRHAERAARVHGELGRELDALHAVAQADLELRLDDDIGDDLLRLMFVACHPVLARPSRVALTLRLLGGLTTEEIGRAFLTSEATIAQRIVRAKRTLAEKEIPFEIPRGAALQARLESILEVVYLIFNEGYTATEGADWMRPEVCDEALRLGRILADLLPGEPEVHGLTSLMEFQASRTSARAGPQGEPILLADQDRALWDEAQLRRGFAALDRVDALRVLPGAYALQAGIAACHARAATVETTDWARIAALYAALATLTPSPIVELNRAVAVSRAAGPAEALVILDELAATPALTHYHLLASVRGDVLERLGRLEDAQCEFERAAGLTRNDSEQALMLRRAQACADAMHRPPRSSDENIR